ncbi:hypothetical protein CCP3SC1_830006 [Gammaproteobacteria bacterium]
MSEILDFLLFPMTLDEKSVAGLQIRWLDYANLLFCYKKCFVLGEQPVPRLNTVAKRIR